MPLSDYLALLALVTAMAFTPGPNTTLAAALAADRGMRVAVRFCMAVPAGWCTAAVVQPRDGRRAGGHGDVDVERMGTTRPLRRCSLPLGGKTRSVKGAA